MDKIKLSQTSVKDLEKDSTCPYRWKKLWLDKEISFLETLAMTKGNYFEQNCLGESAHDDSPKAVLPTTTKGQKTADHVRIDEQIEKFKQMFDPDHEEFRGFTILDIQVKVGKGLDTGVIDFIVKDKDNNKFLADLKLTGDLKSTYSEYSWGNSLSDMDLLQAVTYSRLHKEDNPNEYEGYLPFLYFIFDFSTKKRIKIGKVIITDVGIQSGLDRFNSAREVIQLYQKKGWVYLPSKEECKDCPIKGCAKRILEDKIETEEINF